MGGGAAPAGGCGVRRRVVRAGSRHVRDRRGRAALRRSGGGAGQGARLRWICLGPARRRGWASLRRSRGGERGPTRAGSDRRGEGGAGLPGAAPALAVAASVEPVCRARRARGTSARRAGVASRRRCRGAVGARGEAGVEPRRWGAEHCSCTPRAWAIACGRAGRGPLLPRGGRERVDAAAGVRGAARPVARAAGAGGASVAQGGGLGQARRRWLVAAGDDVARGDRRARPAAGGARAQAARDPGPGDWSCAWRRSSSPTTSATSSRSSRPKATRWTDGCARACGRCGPARARARCAQWWRWHRGRVFRKRARSSCPATSDDCPCRGIAVPAACCRASACRRVPVGRRFGAATLQPVAGSRGA